MRIQAVVDVEATLVDETLVEQEHHQFQPLLGMMGNTTSLMLNLEKLGDKDVHFAMLIQMCSALNVRHIYACSIGETAGDHSTTEHYKMLVQILTKILKLLMIQTQYH